MNEEVIYPSMVIRSQAEAIELLEKENKILRENAEHNDKVVDKVNWENMLLKKENQKQKEVIDKANKLLKEKVKVIPFDENGEGGGLELTDYDIQDLLDILKEVSE